jgi:hypothetical protein
MYVRQPGRAVVQLCAREIGRKEKAYPSGAESLSGCEPLSSSRCDVLNDVRPVAESKGLIKISGAAEDKTTWSGGAGVNPLAMVLRSSWLCHLQASPTTQVSGARGLIETCRPRVTFIMTEYFDLVLWVKESRVASGVPEKIEDKATLTEIAALLFLGERQTETTR